MSGRWFYICDKCGDLVTIEAAPLPHSTYWVCDKCGCTSLWEFDDEAKALQHSRDIQHKARS
jgi:hypothetical protein